MPHSAIPSDVTAVILAGGRGQRVQDADKGLMPYRGRPLIELVLERLRPQVATILINANRNTARYAVFDCDVLSDQLQTFEGPLAGIVCAMASIHTDWLLTVPCDTPFLPLDLTQRLRQAAIETDSTVAAAHDGEQLHPLHALIHRSTLPNLQQYLASGQRKTRTWLQRQHMVRVDFSDQPDSFINLNSPPDFESHSGH